MANEAVIIELTNSSGFPRRYTVADGTAISKGILLTLADPNTAVAVAGSVKAGAPLPAAGIAAIDKEANDGSTEISAWTDGIFDLKASGAINVGMPIMFVGQNCVALADSALSAASGAIIAGYALETAAADEVINCRIRL